MMKAANSHRNSPLLKIIGACALYVSTSFNFDISIIYCTLLLTRNTAIDPGACNLPAGSGRGLRALSGQMSNFGMRFHGRQRLCISPSKPGCCLLRILLLLLRMVHDTATTEIYSLCLFVAHTSAL